MSQWQEDRLKVIWKDICKTNCFTIPKYDPYFQLPSTHPLKRNDLISVPLFLSYLISMVLRKEVGLGRSGIVVLGDRYDAARDAPSFLKEFF